MKAFRIEKDALGSVKVPQKAWYGAHTVRALGNFQISGKSCASELIRAYLLLKKAAAITNRKCGGLKNPKAKWILQSIDHLLGLKTSEWATLFPIDPYQAGAGTSLNMNINEVIANLANLKAGSALGTYSPLHPNDHVNQSQSTNDTFPTATHLAILESSQGLVLELKLLSEAFAKKARLWKNIPKAARTHLQDAVPMQLGDEIGAYATTFRRCASWIVQGQKELEVLGIGGSAAGNGLNVPKRYPQQIIQELRKLTREDLKLSKDLCEAMQSQSPLMYYSSMLRLTGLEVTRICNDLRLLGSGPLTGLAEIFLPEVQPGSSIMPGKVNPSILEMVNQTWFSILGYDQTVAYCTQAGQLELNVMMPMMAHSILEANRIATESLKTLRKKCVVGIQPNRKRLKFYYENTPQAATALSPKLGYEKTALLVHEALRTGKSVLQILKTKDFSGGS